MKWFWNNTTQVGFGIDAVKEHLPKYIKPNSKILCTFGGGSIDKNGARKDVQDSLDALQCEVKWEGGIPPNPEYDRLIEIIEVAKEFKPDMVLAVGGGSVIDGTKFICVALAQQAGVDLWDDVIVNGKGQNEAIPLGVIATLPATGSEWNNGFVISRRSIGWKKGVLCYSAAYPKISLLDPKYTMTLPPRQLRNGLFDAFCHCTDSFLTPNHVPLFDDFWFSLTKELYEISGPLLQPDSSIELHERLIVAASFGLNYIFGLGQEPCWAVHMIGKPLTVKYGIDHGATLAIVMPYWLESQFEARKEKYAKMAEFVFGVKEGTVEEKAHALISNIRNWIASMGLPQKVTDWEGCTVKPEDIDEVTQITLEQGGKGGAIGFRACGTEEVIRNIFKQIIA